MINFVQKPDAALCRIIEASLTYLKKEILDDFNVVGVIHPELSIIFTRDLLLREVNKLEQANIDDMRRYSITDYHYLILDRALDFYTCVVHNEVVDRKGPIPISSSGEFVIGYISADIIIDIMFWDSNYLRLVPQKNAEDYEVSYLVAHPDELKIIETKGNNRGVNYYKKGFEYPYREEIAEEEIERDLK